MRTAFTACMKRRGAVFVVLLLGVAMAPATPAPAADPTFREIASAIVQMQATIKPDARTVRSLGPERTGAGVLIGADGLILTIGYLVLEASSVRVASHEGRTSAAELVAYDHRTGFGLIRAHKDMGLRPMELGASTPLKDGAPLLVLSAGQSGGVTPVRIVSRRPFAGYWEYLLDSAIYTMPPHREYGGGALVDLSGKLIGIGSLFVSDALKPESQSPGNMFVPIDLLKPVMASMIETGRSSQRPRPWLGIYAGVSEGRVYVNRLANGGPGAAAGLNVGDIIVGVKGRRVSGLADLFRKVWSQGEAGADVALDILPFGSESLKIKKVLIKSRDRHGWLKLNH